MKMWRWEEINADARLKKIKKTPSVREMTIKQLYNFLM